MAEKQLHLGWRGNYLRGCVHNLVMVWLQADPIDRRAGMEAYSRYHQISREIADKFSYSLRSVVAAFVSLSPNNGYLNNLRSLVTLVDGHKRGIEVNRLPTSTYNACRDRAWKFLNGEEFLTVNRGPKIRAFYISILNPDDPREVVVDGHMVGAWCGRRLRMKEAAEKNWKYEEVADDVRELANVTGVLPSQVQATVWMAWKRINKSLYDPNLDLFGDHWQLQRSVDDIKPYPVRN